MRETAEMYCVNCACHIGDDNIWTKELIFNDPSGEKQEIPVCGKCGTDPTRLDVDHIKDVLSTLGFDDEQVADAILCLLLEIYHA